MTKLLGFCTTFFILCTVFPSDAYRILGLWPYNGRSHFIMFQQLMKGLADRGHQVDVVSHFPLKTPFPNYTDIMDVSSIGSSPIRQNNITYDYMKPFLHSKAVAYLVATEVGNDLCHYMEHSTFQKIIKNSPKDPPYDLVITEMFGSHCYLAMGYHLGVPVVGISTSAMWPWINDMIANPEEAAYIPHVFSDLTGRMNFWQRIVNTVELYLEKWRFNYYSEPQTELIRKYIGPNAPSVRDVERNVSLILVNSHYSLNGVRPFTTGVVEVGGLHIPKTVPELPKNLEQWLNESKDGFVYISFGAMVKIESFPKKTLHAMYASFAKLAPIRILMKIAKPDELPPGLPSNVLTQTWIPQLAILQHKNIRAFMTHGGLMGTQEAIYYGVPMIGVPLFADQDQNIQIYVQKHVAVRLEVQHLTEESFDAAFNSILHDPSYMKTVKQVSAEFRDRPMTAMDTAIFWIEYVVRHGGTNLRSPAMDLTWWQISLFDVYGVLLSAVIIVIYLSVFVINKLINGFSRKDDRKVVRSKKLK